MEMHEERLEGGVVLMALRGRLDPTTGGQVEARLLALLAPEVRTMILDLGGVDYISSAGLRVLLVVGKQLRERRGQLMLCSVQQYVKQVLDLSGFSTLFPQCASREDALAAVG